MNIITRFFMAATLSCMTFGLLTGQAQAQRGGGGAVVPALPLTFTSFVKVNGTTPKWGGDYTISAPAVVYYYRTTTLNFSIRAQNMNLPDGTMLYVNLYTRDSLTGSTTETSKVQYHCMASPMGVLGKLAIVKAKHDFNDDPFSPLIIRKLEKIEVTDDSGAVLATCIP